MSGLGYVVLEYSWDVFLASISKTSLYAEWLATNLWEVTLGVANQQACFATAAVSNNDKLF